MSIFDDSKDTAKVDDYLQKWVYGVKDHAEYLDLVRDATGFDLIIPDEIGHNAEPTDEELRILRDESDHDRLYI